MLNKAPYITPPFNGEIWRLEIDETTATLLLEIRREDEKLVNFASVDLVTGHINFDNHITPERWLTGIETADTGVLLLHHYQSAKGPVHKAVVAVDAKTAAPLWSNYNLAFDHLTINGPIVYNTQVMPKKLYLADIATGNMIRLYSPAVDIEREKDIRVPVMLTTGSMPFQLPAKPFGNMVHYLEHSNYIIVSLHTHNNGTLNQHLYIMDTNGVIYEDLLNTGIQKIQPEAFVIHKNWLICLKNKNTLMVFDL